MNNSSDLSEIEKKIGYKFKDESVLDNALRHSSYVNEQPAADLDDNERLEFLGDAVLNLVIGHILMRNFPALHEGDLSRMRSNLVNETCLARLARKVELGRFIKLGKGESQTNGRDKNSILSDVFEAVIAAVYVDGGFDAAFRLIENQFEGLVKGAEERSINQDSKSLLQEYSQVHLKVIPRYKVVDESGPDHDKTFRVRLTTKEIETFGTGKSKKAAEQDAARIALEMLNKDIG